jgi:hypothetical protein
MHSKNSSHASQETDRARSSLEELDARIARLSIALRVPLSNDMEVQEAIKNFEVPSVSQERRVGTERRTPERLAMGPERRASIQRSELRALLVMRYGIERQLVERVGVTLTREIIETAAHSLERHGFERGAGGLLVNRDIDNKS